MLPPRQVHPPNELRSAFNELPASFEEVERADLELSFEVLGLEHYFSDIAVFLNADPFEMIVAASGQIGECRNIR